MPLFDKKATDPGVPKETGVVKAAPDATNPKNLTETEVWQSSRRGARRLWFNYKKLLKDSFDKMTRDEQENLISKFCTVFTLGVTVLLILAFSSVFPREIRVFGIPVVLGIAWMVGSRVVTDVVIDRLEGIMRKD